MRTPLIVGVALFAVGTQATARISSSRRSFSDLAHERGAVSEVSLRVSWPDVDRYLSLYARWFLHVDMAPRSGRKLLTVLSREVGNDRNLVFLYWYEDPYKERYYCRYAAEFFSYHLGNEGTRAELRTLYDDASRLLGLPRKDDEAILADLGRCEGNDVPAAASETMRKVDEQLRRLAVSDEASWSIGVNPCRVQRIRAAEDSRSTVRESDLQSCERSLLEQAVEGLAR